MSPQDLLKKTAEILSFKNLKSLILHNFRDVLIITGSLCFIILIIVLFSVISKGNRSAEYFTAEPDEKTNEVPANTKRVYSDDFLLNADDFVLPEIKSFDITSDYVDFLPAKKYQSPDKKIVEKAVKSILDDTIEESTKFNFEKRRE